MIYTKLMQRCKGWVYGWRYIDVVHIHSGRWYCRSGNIREVLIYANFACRTNSQIKKSREIFYFLFL